MKHFSHYALVDHECILLFQKPLANYVAITNKMDDEVQTVFAEFTLKG